MARVPVIRLGDVLLATVLEDLHDRDALRLLEDILSTLERSHARGVLLDVSVVEVIDSFLGRLVHDIAISSRLMGAETVVVGIRPAVAVTLVELGLELKAVHLASSAEKGFNLLRQRIASGK
ncbi:MAG: STAS domain-containing protein [Chloroflexota bacterium]